MSLPVSLVIPVRNESRTIPSLWRSIRDQTLRPDEIVIVDGGSSDGTPALARQLEKADPRVRLVETGGATPGQGRNVGIGLARNDWIALTDGGIVLEPDWLEQLVAVVREDPSVRIVYGHYEPETATFFQRCAALAYVSLVQDTPSGKMRGPFIASTLLHRSVWSDAGGFPEYRASEDLIFMSTVKALGTRTGWAPSAVARWELRPSLLSTFQRFYLYSSQSVLAQRHRDWHYPVLKKYMLTIPFVFLSKQRGNWWAVVPAAGACARVASSIWRRRGDRGLRWAINPVQFATVGVIILTIDVATFAGWVHALFVRSKNRLAPAPKASAQVNAVA